MTNRPLSESELELRLRRLHGRLDATPGFTPALHARIDSLRAVVVDDRARLERRALANRERLETEGRLRRRFWQTLLVTLGAGLAAAIGAWLVGAPVGQLLAALSRGPGNGLNPLVVASLALLVGWLWLAVRGASRGGLRRLAFG